MASDARIRVLACGRRWGKTDACAASIVWALARPSPSRHLIVAPTEEQARLLFDRVIEMVEAAASGPSDRPSDPPPSPLPKWEGEPDAESGPTTFSVGNRAEAMRQLLDGPEEAEEPCREAEQVIGLPRLEDLPMQIRKTPHPHLRYGEHRVMARSGHVSRSLRGHEATHIVIDEAAYVPEELITEVAMPMLATTEGQLTLISTPHGRNHFWRFFQMGQKGENGVWSRHAPSWESPFVSAEFLDVQRELISERAFRVEYGAEFLDGSGRVFPSDRVHACLTRDLPEPAPPFSIGVDWARYEDYTGVAVLSGDRNAAHLQSLERFHGEGWSRMVDQVACIVARYPGARVICDATGVGDPALEMLQGRLRSARIEGLVFTAQTKAQLIDELAWLIDRSALRMRPDPALMRELERFESRGGKLEARSGHDDLVIALALAARSLRAPSQDRIELGSPRRFSRLKGQVAESEVGGPGQG